MQATPPPPPLSPPPPPLPTPLQIQVILRLLLLLISINKIDRRGKINRLTKEELKPPKQRELKKKKRKKNPPKLKKNQQLITWSSSSSSASSASSGCQTNLKRKEVGGVSLVSLLSWLQTDIDFIDTIPLTTINRNKQIHLSYSINGHWKTGDWKLFLN